MTSRASWLIVTRQKQCTLDRGGQKEHRAQALAKHQLSVAVPCFPSAHSRHVRALSGKFASQLTVNKDVLKRSWLCKIENTIYIT